MKISKKNLVALIVLIISFTVFLSAFFVKMSLIPLHTSKIDHLYVNSMVDGSIIHAEVYTPHNAGPSNPLIVVNHGYCGSAHEHRKFCSLFNKEGYIAVAIDARGHGFSTGVLPTDINGWSNLGQDIMSVLFHLVDRAAQFKINTSLIGMIGGSMGGYSSTSAGILYPTTYNKTLNSNSFNLTAVVNLAFSGPNLDMLNISRNTPPPNYLMILGDIDLLFPVQPTYDSFRQVANTSDSNAVLLQTNYYGNFTNYTARKLIVLPGVGHGIIETPESAQIVYSTVLAWFQTSFKTNTSNFEDITYQESYFAEFELDRNLGNYISYGALIAFFAAIFLVLPFLIKKFKKEDYTPEPISFMNQKNRSILGLSIIGIFVLLFMASTVLSPYFTFLQVLGSSFIVPYLLLSIIAFSLIILFFIKFIFPKQEDEFPRDMFEKSNIKVGITTGLIAMGTYLAIHLPLNAYDGTIFIGNFQKIFIFIIYLAILLPYFFVFNIFTEEFMLRQFKQREVGTFAIILTGLLIAIPGIGIYALFTYLNGLFIGNGVFAFGMAATYFGYAIFFGPIIYYLTKNSLASTIFSAIYLALFLTSLPLNM